MQPVALPVVTSHIPATSSGNPMASSAPDSAVVQRRGAQAAPPSSPLPPTTAPPSATAANFSGIAGLGPEEYRRSPRTSEDATPDDAWLERHDDAAAAFLERVNGTAIVLGEDVIAVSDDVACGTMGCGGL